MELINPSISKPLYYPLHINNNSSKPRVKETKIFVPVFPRILICNNNAKPRAQGKRYFIPVSPLM